MKPLFTVHEGEFLVGDHITRTVGKQFDVWVPTKDSGIDLLVTSKKRPRTTVGLQVKFSRDFPVAGDVGARIRANGWFQLQPKKIRDSEADIWVLVILTLRHEKQFVVIPKRELCDRIPHNLKGKWNLYVSVYDNGKCYQVRGLPKHEQQTVMDAGVTDPHRDLSEWLDRWDLLGE